MLDKAKNVWYSTSCSAGVAHLVERDLAKVEVASSSLVARSKKITPSQQGGVFFAFTGRAEARTGHERSERNMPGACFGARVRVAARLGRQRASSPAPKKEVTTYVVASFSDSGRKLKCSGEVNSPSAKVLLRKTLVRRKSVVFCFGRPDRYGTSELGVLFL